jgi:hypothetical protein
MKFPSGCLFGQCMHFLQNIQVFSPTAERTYMSVRIILSSQF